MLEYLGVKWLDVWKLLSVDSEKEKGVGRLEQREKGKKWKIKVAKLTDEYNNMVIACESEVKLLLSRVQLCVTPRTVAHQAPLPMGFSRQEY